MIKYIIIPKADFKTPHLNLSTSRNLDEVRKSLDGSLYMIKSEYWYTTALNLFPQYDLVDIFEIVNGTAWLQKSDEESDGEEESLGFMASIINRFFG